VLAFDWFLEGRDAHMVDSVKNVDSGAENTKIRACWDFWDEQSALMREATPSEAAADTCSKPRGGFDLVQNSVRMDFIHYRMAQRYGSSAKALPYRSRTVFHDGRLGSIETQAFEVVKKFFGRSPPSAKVSSDPAQYRAAYSACYSHGYSSHACYKACERASTELVH